MKTSLVVRLSATLLLSLLLIGAFSSQVTSVVIPKTPLYGGTLVVATETDYKGFGPTTPSTGLGESQVKGQFLNTLLDYDLNTLEPLPKLATSWEVSSDGLTYTFHLVKNAFWQDGKPFTSADVKWNLDWQKERRPGYATVVFMDHCETPDPYTVVIKLTSTFPSYLGQFRSTDLFMFPPQVFTGPSSTWIDNPQSYDNCIGTGPFLFGKWVKGQYVELTRNPKYWVGAGMPYVDKIRFRPITDPAQRAAALENHEVDVTTGSLPAADLDRLSKIPGIKISTIGSSGYNIFRMNFNLRRPFFQDLRVREALTRAIDKDSLVKLATLGYGETAWSPMYKGVKYYVDDLPRYTYDPAKAEKLLDDAGYPRDKVTGWRTTVGLYYSYEEEVRGKMAQILTQYFEKIGVKIDLRSFDKTTLDQLAENPPFPYDMAITLGPGRDEATMRRWYHSSNVNQVSQNTCGYIRPEADRLIDALYKEFDEKKRADLYRQLQTLLVQDPGEILLFYYKRVDAYWDEWVGIPPGPNEGVRDGCEAIYWKKGSQFSPSDVQASVTAAEKTLSDLQAQYYDVAAALKTLAQAKAALNANDYVTAYKLAKDAVQQATPPYWLYGSVAVVIIAIIALPIYFRRRKRK